MSNKDYSNEEYMNVYVGDYFMKMLEAGNSIYSRVMSFIVLVKDSETNLVNATQYNIADALSVNVRSINRAMKQLKDNDFIKYKEGHKKSFMVNPYIIYTGDRNEKADKARQVKLCKEWDDLD